ncbi:YqhG family protein [Lentibacillus juripiscarius]|uniref:YqhG family protein n=1 Tax=Lentibacillus juripiscarius TaxID=257446 RepID=A0ABW5V422_9BACI
MAINDLHHFLESYFTAHHCSILHNQDGMLTVQLTEKMDRALMNRPFYWHYIKKMGHPGDPKQLTLITDPEKRDGKHEWVHFGSPRLHQILNHLHANEKYTKLFEAKDTNQKAALFPWLVANIKISYQGKQKKDEMVSIGLHLVNGTMKVGMMEEMEDKSMQNSISDYCYTIAPIITLKSGFKRMETVLEDYVQNQPHDWAETSLKTMEEEINLLRHFYKGENEDNEIRKEMDEIKERHYPSIHFEVINGGVFYLAEQD